MAGVSFCGSSLCQTAVQIGKVDHRRRVSMAHRQALVVGMSVILPTPENENQQSTRKNPCLSGCRSTGIRFRAIWDGIPGPAWRRDRGKDYPPVPFSGFNRHKGGAVRISAGSWIRRNSAGTGPTAFPGPRFSYGV
jgi:hypothetical protein